MDNVINGCYKLSWRERIGFCSGDLAQNLIYQTVSIWECRNCGHIVIGTEAPDVCPVCFHPQSYFEINAENY